MEQYYEITTTDNFRYYYNRNVFDKEIDLLNFLKELKNDVVIDTIRKYYIIYEHTKNMIPYDYYDKFSENWYFNKKHKLNKEDIIPIKVKDYKDFLIKENNNYLIKYKTISTHPNNNELLITFNSIYTSNDLKQIKSQLLSLGKSNQIFDIVLLQYDDLKHLYK